MICVLLEICLLVYNLFIRFALFLFYLYVFLYFLWFCSWTYCNHTLLTHLHFFLSMCSRSGVDGSRWESMGVDGAVDGQSMGVDQSRWATQNHKITKIIQTYENITNFIKNHTKHIKPHTHTQHHLNSCKNDNSVYKTTQMYYTSCKFINTPQTHWNLTKHYPTPPLHHFQTITHHHYPQSTLHQFQTNYTPSPTPNH